jgi:hypothetical protein
MSNITSGLIESLTGVQISGCQQNGQVQVFHLRWSGSGEVKYATLDEALAAKWIDVTEVNESGQVPNLKIVNRSEHMVFIMAGEQLVGGKQNRVVNASMMIPSRSEMPLPVTCVEQGRWGYRNSTFSSGRSSSQRKLRAMMSKQVTTSYKRVKKPVAEQQAVWDEVFRTLDATDSRSASFALEDVFLKYEKDMEEATSKFPTPTDCHGTLFVINGQIAGLDLFDKPETLQKLWPKLIKSSIVESLEPSDNVACLKTEEEIWAWLKSAKGAKIDSFDSPGVGKDIRIEGEGVEGATLVVDEHPIHMELFPRPESSAP